MRPLTIFLCGKNIPILQYIAQAMTRECVIVQTSTELTDCLRISQDEFDFLIIELDGLYGHLLALLPTIRRNTPNLPLIGIFTNSKINATLATLAYSLDLDDYCFEVPQPEELIMRFPQVANKYLYETNSSTLIDTYDTLERQFKVVLKIF